MFRGSIPALVTPFRDGKVDEGALAGLVDWHVSEGSHGIVAVGTTGETPTLSHEEHERCIEIVVETAARRIPVIAGAGSNNTAESVSLMRHAKGVGADAALVVTPYYNKPNRAGLRAHFEAVAEAAPELPIVLYNIPSRVVVNLEPAFLSELSSIDNVIGVKQANDAELGPIEGLEVLAGNDGVFLETLEFGGAGGILVAANVVGSRMREIWDAAQEGDIARAREIDAELRGLYEAMSVHNPIPVKAALEMLGLASERMRLPLVPADEEQRASVRAALEGAGVLATTG
jgi:4-hydroxy-tetrahydrodipicolinate synthase